MPYVRRPATTVSCAHCGTPFESRNLRRKYCSNSCNVLASRTRTGNRGEPRATRADLERTLATVVDLLSASRPAPEPATRRSPQEIYSRTGSEVVASKPGLAEAKEKVKDVAALIAAQAKAGELAPQIAAGIRAQKRAKKRG
jgi:hypothetical protein